MLIVAGLGNPGRKYAKTRHNAGYAVIDELAKACGIKMNDHRFHASVGTGFLGDKKAVLIKPETYMNLSGDSIYEAVSYYKTDLQNELIVVFDDINLATGQLRLRRKGSAGGHNGIKHIIRRLGTGDFMRVRVGVGEKPEDTDLVDHVLGRFSRQEKPVMDDAVKQAAEAVLFIAAEGIDRAMNKYN